MSHQPTSALGRLWRPSRTGRVRAIAGGVVAAVVGTSALAAVLPTAYDEPLGYEAISATDTGIESNGVVVFERDFEDGQVAGGDGGVFEVVANPNGEGLVQRITTEASWHGLQIPGSVFDPGATYRFEADVLRPAGSAAMNARFEGADDPWPWVVGNHPMSDTEWTTISGDFTWNTVAPMAVRLVNGGEGAFYVDNVVVTRTAAVSQDPPLEFEPYIVAHWDFTDPADLAAFEASGGAVLTRIPNPHGEGYVMASSNRSADWHGPRLAHGIMTAGAEYRIDTVARTAAGVGDSQIQPRGLSEGGGWTYMGNQDITDSQWTATQSGSWQAGVLPQINLGSPDIAGLSEYTIYFDEITLWRTAPAPVIDEDWEFEGLFFDFEDGFQGWFSRHAAASLTHESGDGAQGSGHFVRIDNRSSQGDGPMLDVSSLLAPMRRFEISGYARFVGRDTVPGPLTISSQTGPSTFTNLLQNIPVGNEWTFFEGEFMMPAFTDMAYLYFETPWQSGATGDITAFEIDQITISLPEPLAWEQNLIPLRYTLPGIHTGVAVDSRELTGEHAELITHHFTHLVGENHMKPEAWFDGARNFRMHPEARQIVDFAVENDMTVFGHVLVWHSQTPAWLFAQNQDVAGSPELTNSPEHQEIMLGRMRDHIRSVAEEIVSHYGPFGSPGNPFSSYEVANEVVAGSALQGQQAGGMRPASPWTRIFYVPGEPNSAYRFVREAFIYADAIFNGEFHVDGTFDNPVPAGADNRITLWINDYNTERGTAGGAYTASAKRVQLLNLVNYLIESGAPIDGVGHQFHAGLEWDVRGLYYALELFAADNPWLASFPDGSRGILQAVTEIDVTIPGIGTEGVSQAQLIAQGHYYRQAFDIIRNHQVRHGDIDTVTIWGLTDGRSWRAAQLPLLFNDDLTAKHAFFGAVANHHILTGLGDQVPQRPGVGGRPAQVPENGWTVPQLETVIAEADVFGAYVDLSDASFDAPVWLQLPTHALADGAGSFHLRHHDGYLSVLANLNGLESPLSTPAQPYYLQVQIEGRAVVISQEGVVTEGDWNGEVISDVTALTRIGDNEWQAIVRIPTGLGEGDTADFQIARRDRSRVDLGAWSMEGSGILTFVEDLSFQQIASVNARPVLGDFDAAIWDSAASFTVDTHADGSPDGATADVRAVWYHGPSEHHFTNQAHATLYLLVDVTDATIDTSSPNNHEQDSVEFFVGLQGRGAPHDMYDAQFRVNALGDVSFSRGNTGIQAQRIRAHAELVDGGYRIMVALTMATGGGHQADQWNYTLAGVDSVHAFDVQINDATAGSRTSVHTWADPTASGFSSTARQGVIQLVETLGGGAPGGPGGGDNGGGAGGGDAGPGAGGGDAGPGDTGPGAGGGVDAGPGGGAGNVVERTKQMLDLDGNTVTVSQLAEGIEIVLTGLPGEYLTLSAQIDGATVSGEDIVIAGMVVQTRQTDANGTARFTVAVPGTSPGYRLTLRGLHPDGEFAATTLTVVADALGSIPGGPGGPADGPGGLGGPPGAPGTDGPSVGIGGPGTPPAASVPTVRAGGTRPLPVTGGSIVLLLLAGAALVAGGITVTRGRKKADR